MGRVSPETMARWRALIEDGKLRVGSSKHLTLIDFDIKWKTLGPRNRTIVRLATAGWTQRLIARAVDLSQPQVNAILREFYTGEENVR